MTFASSSCSHCYYLTFSNLTKMLMLAFCWRLFKQGFYILAWLKPCLGFTDLWLWPCFNTTKRCQKHKLQIVFSMIFVFFFFRVHTWMWVWRIVFAVLNLFPSTPFANTNPKHKLCNINCIYQTVNINYVHIKRNYTCETVLSMVQYIMCIIFEMMYF